MGDGWRASGSFRRIAEPTKRSDVFSIQISVKLAALFSFVFAAVCLWFAVDAFKALAEVTDPAQTPGAADFVWFWGFLAGVGLLLGVVSWTIADRQTEEKDD